VFPPNTLGIYTRKGKYELISRDIILSNKVESFDDGVYSGVTNYFR
jgi:hypothetical protein